MSGGDLFVTNLNTGTIGEYTTSGEDSERRADIGAKPPRGYRGLAVGLVLVCPKPRLGSMALTGFAALGFVGVRGRRSEVGRRRSLAGSLEFATLRNLA